MGLFGLDVPNGHIRLGTKAIRPNLRTGIQNGLYCKSGDRACARPYGRLLQLPQTTVGLKSAAVGSRGVTTTPVSHKTAKRAAPDVAWFDSVRPGYFF